MKYVIYIVSILALLTACTNKEEENTDTSMEEVKTETTEAINTAVEYTLDEKKAFMEKIEAEKDNTKTRITALKKKLTAFKEDKKAMLQEQVAVLETRQQTLEEKIRDLQSSTEASYYELKVGVDSAFAEMERALKKASSEFESAM